jgi:hypothetical protein
MVEESAGERGEIENEYKEQSKGGGGGGGGKNERIDREIN